MTPEQARWVRVHRETFEQALRETEQDQREMLDLASHLSPGPLREAWEQTLALMAERLRRQREAWDRAVATDGATTGETELTRREAALFRDVARLLQERGASGLTPGQAVAAGRITPEEVTHLAEAHGVRLGHDGQVTRAELDRPS